jgi:cytochrome c oxidase subunit 1
LCINEQWLKSQFLIIFVGVNLTFFPQHFLGLAGIPRRYSDYPDAYTTWNIVSTVGSTISLFGILFFLFIIWESIVTSRMPVYPTHLNSSIEWYQKLPPMEHSYSELPLLTN